MTSTILSVTTLSHQIKSLLESTFVTVSVEGEVSRPTYHSSGHLYFTLKDANAVLACVMFKGNNQKLRFRVEEGLKVVVTGGITLYAPRGAYQLVCATMEPSGVGSLALAYEQLKKKLEAEGLFASIHKKPLPRFPQKIALVTSRTGAALQDMLRVATLRWPLVELVVVNTLVQGEGAKEAIAEAIGRADRLGVDVIVVGRGGGSVEDLWAFNEECVVRAIFAAKTPVVSAVGHEIDTPLSDFVADLRAPTPSAAMEMLLPDRTEMLLLLDNLIDSLKERLETMLAHKHKVWESLLFAYRQNAIDARLRFVGQEINTTAQRLRESAAFLLTIKSRTLAEQHTALQHGMARLLHSKALPLAALQEALQAADPTQTIRTGYAQVTQHGKPIDPDTLQPGERCTLQTPHTLLDAQILERHLLPTAKTS